MKAKRGQLNQRPPLTPSCQAPPLRGAHLDPWEDPHRADVAECQPHHGTKPRDAPPPPLRESAGRALQFSVGGSFVRLTWGFALIGVGVLDPPVIGGFESATFPSLFDDAADFAGGG